MNATIAVVDPHNVGGVFRYVSKSASKCYNKGAVSYSGSSYRGVYVRGLAARVIKISQSYNKGAVTVKMLGVPSGRMKTRLVDSAVWYGHAQLL